jgi:hypothetical protein
MKAWFMGVTAEMGWKKVRALKALAHRRKHTAAGESWRPLRRLAQ